LRTLEGEFGFVLVAGDLARDKVAVLVHRVAEEVLNVRPDDHVVGAGGRDRVEEDVELGAVRAGDGDDVVDGDRAVGAGETDLIGEKGGRVHRLVEGHAHVVHVEGQAAAGGRAGDDLRALESELGDVLVAGDLAGDAVVVLIHLVAGDVPNVRPDDHGV